MRSERPRRRVGAAPVLVLVLATVLAVSGCAEDDAGSAGARRCSATPEAVQARILGLVRPGSQVEPWDLKSFEAREAVTVSLPADLRDQGVTEVVVLRADAVQTHPVSEELARATGTFLVGTGADAVPRLSLGRLAPHVFDLPTPTPAAAAWADRVVRSAAVRAGRDCVEDDR